MDKSETLYHCAEAAAPILKKYTKRVAACSNAGNAFICVDSLRLSGRAGANFVSAPNTLSRVFFVASFTCGVISAGSSGVALGTSYIGIPITGWLGSIGSRGFYKLGKVSLHAGKVSSGKIL